MGFFNDIGTFVGGLAVALVPGVSSLAKTGVFGDTLAAAAGAPGTPPVAVAVTSSPAIMQSVASQAFTPPAVAAATAAPISGTVNIPRPFLMAITAEAQKVTYGTYVPRQAFEAVTPTQVTPLTAIAAAMPVSPALPGIGGAAVVGEPGLIVTIGGVQYLRGGTAFQPTLTPMSQVRAQVIAAR